MRHRALIPVSLLLALLLALPSCGSKQSASERSAGAATALGGGTATLPAQPVQSDIAALVPDDTDVLLYAPSLERLVSKVKTLVAEFSPEAAADVDVSKMLQSMQIPEDVVDPARAIAVAVSIPAKLSGPPPFTMLIPLRDPAKAQEELSKQGMKPTIHGRYLALAQTPTTSGTGGTQIAKELPEGDLVVRVNLARLAKTFQPQIDEALGKLSEATAKGVDEAGPGAAGLSTLMKSFQDFAKDLVASAEGLDLSLSIDGTKVSLRALFTAKAGSKLAGAPPATTALADLAGALPQDFPVEALLSLDLPSLMKTLRPFLDSVMQAMPEAQRSAMAKLMDEGTSLMADYGNRQAIAMRIDDKGIAAVGVCELRDAKAYFQKYDAYLKDAAPLMKEMGMTFVEKSRSTVAGAEVRNYSMTFDFDKFPAAGGRQVPPEVKEKMKELMASMFGPDGMEVHVADLGQKAVIVYGHEPDLLERSIQAAKSGSGPSGALAEAVADAGGKPNLLVRLELRSFLRGVMAFVPKAMPEGAHLTLPEIPEGTPVPVVLYASADGRHYLGGLNVDVGALKDLIEPLLQGHR